LLTSFGSQNHSRKLPRCFANPKQSQEKQTMRFSVLAILLLSALVSVVSAATAAAEDHPSHQTLRRRRLLIKQQVTLKVKFSSKLSS
jgi:hypothetical protein